MLKTVHHGELLMYWMDHSPFKVSSSQILKHLDLKSRTSISALKKKEKWPLDTVLKVAELFEMDLNTFLRLEDAPVSGADNLSGVKYAKAKKLFIEERIDAMDLDIQKIKMILGIK
ncbi:MAG: hypothetical protein GY816_08790 [Cytophagales bacterium]|nr:hypothetical protein [Cytophagales bacterium]